MNSVFYVNLSTYDLIHIIDTVDISLEIFHFKYKYKQTGQ